MEQLKSEADAENKKLREDLLAEAEEYAKKIEAMEGIYSKRIKDMEEQREKEATVCFSFSNTILNRDFSEIYFMRPQHYLNDIYVINCAMAVFPRRLENQANENGHGTEKLVQSHGIL